MNVRKTINRLFLAGAAAAVLPMTAAHAVSHPVFDGWTVSGGTISATCQSGASCSTLVSGDGFLQQQVDTGSDSYIRTIITDAGANSATNTSGSSSVNYSDESFVLSGGTTSGIAGKQSLTDAAFGFTGTSELYAGWANSLSAAAQGNVVITQSFSDAGVSGVFGDEFENSFKLAIKQDAAGAVTGKSMSIGQIVEMGDGAAVNTSDIQKFIVEQRTGSFITATEANAGFDLAATSFDAANNPLNGGTSAWVAGDDVLFVWLGQQVSDETGGLSVFGFESVQVDPADGSATRLVDTFSTTTPGIDASQVDVVAPFNWDSVVTGSAAPTLPAPAIDGSTDAGALE